MWYSHLVSHLTRRTLSHNINKSPNHPIFAESTHENIPSSSVIHVHQNLLHTVHQGINAKGVQR